MNASVDRWEDLVVAWLFTDDGKLWVQVGKATGRKWWAASNKLHEWLMQWQNMYTPLPGKDGLTFLSSESKSTRTFTSLWYPGLYYCTKNDSGWVSKAYIYIYIYLSQVYPYFGTVNFKMSSRVHEGDCSPHNKRRSSYGENICSLSIKNTRSKPAAKCWDHKNITIAIPLNDSNCFLIPPSNI